MPESENGSTPIDPDEAEDLIPQHLEIKAELNQWEATNITQAQDWVFDERTPDVLSVEWLRELHRKMFAETWKWAGAFRRTDKSISPFHWTEVSTQMRELVANTREQYERGDKLPHTIDEIALRFHHRLVLIHPWANGNGRHGRLATDALLLQWGRPPFSWGSGADLIAKGESRQRYLEALRSADAGKFGELRAFVRC